VGTYQMYILQGIPTVSYLCDDFFETRNETAAFFKKKSKSPVTEYFTGNALSHPILIFD
jgi:hypothetical protein